MYSVFYLWMNCKRGQWPEIFEPKNGAKKLSEGLKLGFVLKKPDFELLEAEKIQKMDKNTVLYKLCTTSNIVMMFD